ncbi:MAG: hypothetical protein KJO76_05245 [Gammaproteobacteria bacterium]|nr:hypothetical protein [Gammaproteobacteria bacterium]
MTSNKTRERDPFAFSLRGMRSMNSFMFAPAIEQDHINKALAKRLGQPPEDQPDTGKEIRSFWGRFWLQRRRRAA